MIMNLPQVPPVMCTRAFVDKSAIHKHVKTLHNQKILCIQCQTCDGIRQDKCDLLRHKSNVHVQNFQCEKCDNGFVGHENMKNHIQTDHVTGMDFQKCDNIFTDKNDLSFHMNRDQDRNLNFFNSTKSSILKSFESLSEDELFNHEHEYKNSSQAEATFYNPFLA